MKAAHPAEPPFGASPLHLLHRALQVTEGLFQREVDVDGLTSRQIIVLMAVASCEGASQTALVRLTGMDRSTLADVVRRLVKRGLLRRRRRKCDARAYEVRLTDEGQSLLEHTAGDVGGIDQEVLSALPPENAERFCADLRRIVETLEARRWA